MRWSKLLTTFAVLSSLSTIGCLGTSSSDDYNPPQPFTPNQSANPQTDKTTETLTELTKALGGASSGQARACYNDLCKGELSIIDLFAKSGLGSPAQEKYFAQYIEPLATKLMKARHQAKHARIAMIEKHEAEFSDVELSTVPHRIAKSIILIYKDKLINKEDVKSIYTKLADEPFFIGASVKFGSHGLPGYFAEVHKDVPLKKAIQLEANYIVKMQEKINKAVGVEFLEVIHPAIKRARGGGEVDNVDLDLIMRNSYGMHLLDILIFGRLSSEIDQVKLPISKLSKEIEKSKFKENAKKLPEFSKIEMDKCRVLYFQSINLSPTAEQSAVFRTQMDHVRDASLEVVDRKSPAYDKIKNSEFLLPYTREEVNLNWAKTISNEIKEEQNSLEHTKESTLVRAFLTALIEALQPAKEEIFCQDYFTAAINDRIYVEMSASRLSWLSVMYPQYGIQIMAHEIGHIAFKYNENHEHEVSCLKDKQGNTDLYAAEDYSDLFANKVEKILEESMQFKKANFGCLVVPANPDEGLINSDSKDPHSSHLYRALQTAINRREAIPASCEQLAQSTSPKATLRCE